MEQINFQPVFDYIDKTKEELKSEIINEVKPEIRGLRTSVDNLAKEVKDIREELHVSNHRHDKTEVWIKKAAPKVGIPFEY